MAPDVRVDNQGSVFLVHADSETARQWCDENLPDDTMRFGAAYVVEHRFIRDVVHGMQTDGLMVE